MRKMIFDDVFDAHQHAPEVTGNRVIRALRVVSRRIPVAAENGRQCREVYRARRE